MGDVLGGVTDFFFGNDEQVEPSQVGTTSTMSSEQLQLLKDLIGKASSGVQDGGQFYAGQRVAGSSPIQNSAFNSINSLLRGTNFQQPLTDSLTKPVSDSFDYAGTQDFYKKAIYDPAMKTFMNETAPAIQEKYVSQNALESGGYNRALTKSMADMATDTQGQMANILYGSEEAQKNRDFNANESYNNRALTSTNLLSMLGLAGGEDQRNITQQGLTSKLNVFNEKQDYNNPYLQLALNLLNPQPESPIIEQGYYEDNPGFFDFAQGFADIAASFVPGTPKP